MRDAYCSTIGYQFEHISSHQQRIWLREMIETGAHRQPLAADEKERLLHRLIDVFQFERFLGKTYLGAKVFSIEGLDVVVPMLDEVGHPRPPRRRRRRRLRHGPPRPAQRPRPQPRPAGRIDPRRVRGLETAERGEGASRRSPTAAPATSNTTTATAASTRSFERREDLGPPLPEPEPPRVRRPGGDRRRPLPAEQVRRRRADPGHDERGPGPAARRRRVPRPGRRRRNAEPAGLRGYSTGGTVHIIQDNQVGFTTDPEDARSTPYAGDLAKGFNVPIIHVNADDVEACISAVRLAMAYRERWHRDVVIDVIGYRRYGHNETDEPAYTQPAVAAKIKEHKPVSELYAEQADRRGRDHRRGRPEGGRRPQSGDVEGAERPARADGRGRLRGPDGRHRHRRTRPHREPAGRHRADRRPADPPERGTAARARTASTSTASSAARSANGPTRWPKAGSTTARPRASPSARCSPRASTSGSPARTPSAAPSPTATSSSTTRTPASSTRRCST